MLSQVLVTVVGLVDIAMVGRIGPKAQAAVGYASQFFALAQSALFAIGFACVAVMARAIGARDLARARSGPRGLAGARRSSSPLAFTGVILAAPRSVLGWLSAAPDVIDLAVPYLQLVMLGSVLMAVALTLESALRANRDTQTPMRVAAVVTAVKLGLNARADLRRLRLPAPRARRSGPRDGRVAGRGGGALLGRDRAPAVAARPSPSRRADLAAARTLLPELARIAVPGVAERLVMNLALLSYFGVLGRYGTVAVAAYTIGVRILAFSWIPGTAYAQAVATLIGQALGAGDRAGATRAGWRAAKLALSHLGRARPRLRLRARAPRPPLHLTTPRPSRPSGPSCSASPSPSPSSSSTSPSAAPTAAPATPGRPSSPPSSATGCSACPSHSSPAEIADLGLVAVWAVLILDHVARAAWLLISFRRGKWQDGGRRRRA